MTATDSRPTNPAACIPNRFSGKVLLDTGAAQGSITRWDTRAVILGWTC
jgi:hypothetical protein